MGPPLQADAAGDRGAIAGLATTTKGIGLLIGPLLAGAAIDLLSPYLDDTRGYQVLWPILGVPDPARDPARRAALSGRAGQAGPGEPEAPEPIV